MNGYLLTGKDGVVLAFEGVVFAFLSISLHLRPFSFFNFARCDCK